MLMVTLPRAPVAGCSVMVPEVALPMITLPAVPDAPRDSAPSDSVALLSVSGADPAPPPTTMALEANVADELSVVVFEK